MLALRVTGDIKIENKNNQTEVDNESRSSENITKETIGN